MHVMCSKTWDIMWVMFIIILWDWVLNSKTDGVLIVISGSSGSGSKAAMELMGVPGIYH